MMPSPDKPAADMMTTREVADYLRIKERKVYDLVRTGRIPCTRVTGKLLFPKALIDRWMAESTALSGTADSVAPPPVVAGSRDPLLDWAVRESGSGLALMAGGSADGLRRLVAGEAMVAGMHLLDPASGAFNIPAVREAAGHLGVVAIEWAGREEGLLLAPGNPKRIGGIADLPRRARVIRRQTGAGARVLFDHMAAAAGVAERDLIFVSISAMTGQEVGLTILEDKADAGIGLRATARQLRLDFVPLTTERFDLVLRRRDYFEPPFQRLLAFAATEAFRARAAELGGYDVSGLGRVRYNAP